MRTMSTAAAALSFVALAWPVAATASCIRQTAEQQLRSADVVFVGEALEGPTATGVQRFRVERYVKGAGADVVRVSTGVVARGDGTGSVTSVSVEAAAGERWRIYASRSVTDGTLETSVCAGSEELGARGGAGPSDHAPTPDVPEAGDAFADRVAAPLGVLVLVLAAISAAVAATRLRRSA
jgi:hypothetical protein